MIQYPILATMARDFLAIQGSVAPSERAFSNASFTDSKHRNRISPAMFESLQILKSAYRNGHFSATDEAEKFYKTLIQNDYEFEEKSEDGGDEM